jgi:UDP-N-acetylmuramoyl-L-alanyl-D-glutamate--2,6-diaminopimelate ligase
MSDAEHGRRSGRSRRVTLSSILPIPRFIGCDDIVARGCQDDPERCRPGDVFVARMTPAGDGHEDVMRAVARGASGVIAERIVSTAGVPLCLVNDADWAFARLCHALAGDPGQAMRVIAVTGTSGKTTTAWLAASVLAEGGRRVGVLSDLGCIDADGTVPEIADYSQPAAFAGWLGRLAAAGCTHAVIEVSSRMLAEQALAGVSCDIVAVTNLASAHLDLHGTQRAYHAIKSRILDALADEGCLVTGACGGDEPLARLRRRAVRRSADIACLTAGLKPGCDLSATPVDRSLFGQTFLMQAAGQMMPVAVDTPVASFVSDSLLAAAIGMRCGVPLERVARGLEAAGSVSGRMERLDRGQDAAVFVDSPSSGHGLAATLSSLRRLTGGRLVAIAEERWAEAIGGGGFMGRIKRWCNDCIVVPESMMSDEAGDGDIAAYARIDRLLASLGRRDCLIVLGGPAIRGMGPAGPDDGSFAAAAMVDGWLQLAHPPRMKMPRRRAA